jgi:hypothetical protein
MTTFLAKIKVAALLIGAALTLTLTLPIAAMAQRYAGQTADWYLAHPDAMKETVDWCNDHPTEMQQQVMDRNDTCPNAIQAYGSMVYRQARPR